MNHENQPSPQEVQDGTIKFLKRYTVGLLAIVATLSAANHLGLFGDTEQPAQPAPTPIENTK